MITQPRVERWFIALCVVPGAATLSVYLEASLAALSLGHWPIPSIDDPAALATFPLHFVVAAAVLLTYPAPVVTFTFALRSWRTMRQATAYQRWLSLFVAGHVALQLSARLDPGRVWYWWWD